MSYTRWWCSCQAFFWLWWYRDHNDILKTWLLYLHSAWDVVCWTTCCFPKPRIVHSLIDRLFKWLMFYWLTDYRAKMPPVAFQDQDLCNHWSIICSTDRYFIEWLIIWQNGGSLAALLCNNETLKLKRNWNCKLIGWWFAGQRCQGLSQLGCAAMWW